MWSCDAVMIDSSNVKIVFFWYMILGTKNSIFFWLSFISRLEKLVQTGVKYGWWVRLCVVNALTFRWWSHLLLGLAILSSCVCSSSGAFLHQPLFGACKFGAPNCRPWYQRLLRRPTYRCSSVTARQTDIKRHPAADMLHGGPTDKPGKLLPVSLTCELKATERELKSDTHWWNWLCFQQAYIKASNRTFTVQMRYTHNAYRHWTRRPFVALVKGMIVDRWEEGN